MKKRKYFITALLLLVATAIGYGWYLYNKKPPDSRTQTAYMELKADELLAAFRQDEAAANRVYVDKVLIVSGKVRQVESNTAGQTAVHLDTGDPLAAVVCSFYTDESVYVKNIAPGTIVRIKGICTGALADVILNRCSMVK